MLSSRTNLLHRLNRIQGQIDALKRSIERPDQDCLENVRQVKAAHSAMKRFGEEYVRSYALLCARKERATQKFSNQIDALITSAFTI